MRDCLVEASPVRCPELFRNDDVDALTDGLFRAESENRFGAAVPHLYYPVQVCVDDSLLHAGYDGSGDGAGIALIRFAHIVSVNRCPAWPIAAFKDAFFGHLICEVGSLQA